MLQELKRGTANAVDGQNAVLWIPDNLKAGEKRAGKIFLYGMGETYPSKSAFSTLYINSPAKYLKAGWKPDYIVLCVQQGATWLTPEQCDKIVNAALSRFPIDPKQLCVTGLSDGAITWLKYITEKQEYADKVKWLVEFSGDVHQRFFDNIAFVKNIWVRAYHCPTDKQVLITSIRKAVPLLKKEGCDATLTEFPYSDGNKNHGGWYKYYDPNSALFAFNFLEQVAKPQPYIPPIDNPLPPIVETTDMQQVPKINGDYSFTKGEAVVMYTNKTSGAKIGLPKPQDAKGFEIGQFRNEYGMALTFSEPLYHGAGESLTTVNDPGSYRIRFDDVEGRYYIIHY